MKKNEDVALTTDDPAAAVTVYPGLEQWLSFRAEEEGRYIFTFRNTNEEDRTSRVATIRAERDTFSEWLGSCTYGSGGSACEIYIPADMTVYCYIINATAYDLSAAVSVEKVTVHEWTQEAVELAPGEEKWFSYTAAGTEAAKHTFTFTGTIRDTPDVVQYSDLNTRVGSVDITQYTVREDGYNYTGKKDCYLEADGTVYWKIENTSSTDTRQIKMKAEKVDITALTGDETVSEAEVPAYSSKWFSFTSNQSARYAFTFTTTSQVNVFLYTAIEATESKYFDYQGNRRGSFTTENNGSGEYEGTEDWYIPEGGTVYWKVDNPGSADVTVKVAAGQVEVMEMTEDMAANGIEIPMMSAKWIKFTAAESARYIFTLINSTPGYIASLYAYLYEDLDQETSTGYVIYNNWNGGYEYYLEQGETIYWKAPDKYTTDITMTIKAEPIAIDSLKLAQDKEISINADDSYEWMRFDVEETGMYGITVTNSADSTTSIVLDRYAALDSASSDPVGQVSSGDSATYRYSFTKGMSVYLKASRYTNSDSAAAAGTILIEKTAGTQALVVGTGTEVSVDTETASVQRCNQ